MGARVWHGDCWSVGMAEWIDKLEDRSKRFAISAIRFARHLERRQAVPRSVVWQFIDSSTAVAANHRAARRSRSKRELLSKLSVVAEEADETVFWLELIAEVSEEPVDGVPELQREATELRAIFAASAATLRSQLQTPRGKHVPESGAPGN